jgi:hypothetical protein
MMAQIIGPLITGVMGFLIALAMYGSIKSAGKQEGAQAERARVETAERKIDAKIEKRVRSTASKPTDSMLSKWERP